MVTHIENILYFLDRQIDNLGIYHVPQSMFHDGKEKLEWGWTEGNKFHIAAM